MRPIVALIDFADAALVAEVLRGARRMAQTMNARLFLLNVEMPEANFDGHEFRTDLSRKGIARELRGKHRALRIFELASQHLGVKSTALMVRSTSLRGNPTRKILQELDRLDPELVVVGSHGHGPLHQMFVGSVSEAVIRRAHRPVLVIPTAAPKERRVRSLKRKGQTPSDAGKSLDTNQ
jgi:nucleotide-binding universal stress UspA family protein